MKPEQIKKTEPIIKTMGLSKSFGPTKAVNDVNIEIYRGQITGLIGENGSGKSTICSLISGMQPPSSGSMEYKGNIHKPKTMIEAKAAGIGMIVQEQGYVPGISIAQNIFLGEENRFSRLGFISRGKMNQVADLALKNIGFDDVDPNSLIDSLNIQDRKLVEVARVMANSPDVLIIDETTTALSQKGRNITYSIMKQTKEENKAVIFISHDLDELMEVCDTLTILRDGKLISTLDKQDFDVKTIKRLMVGRELGNKYYRTDFASNYSDEIVLKADRITTANGLLTNFSFSLHKGEILGIGGLSHNGMHELGKALFGYEKILTGNVLHMKSGQSIKSCGDAFRHSIGYVSKDRDAEALVLSASIEDNIAAAGLDKLVQMGFLLPGKVKKYVLKQVEDLSIKCASIDQNVQYLSGGNKQKVVFGKWVGRDCDILILDCPTRGVDVGVKAAMYNLIEEMKEKGKSIIIISEELAELIGMCDRLLILKDGRFGGEFMRSEKLSEQDIVECMI